MSTRTFLGKSVCEPTLGCFRVLIAMLTMTTPARAGESYRGEVLMADGVALGLGTLAIVSSETSAGPWIATASLATYLSVPPILHGIHDRGGRAGASAGLRLLLPAFVGVVGLAFTPGGGKNGFAALAGGAVGAGLGIVAAMLIDDFALSTREEDVVNSPAVLRFGGTF